MNEIKIINIHLISRYEKRKTLQQCKFFYIKNYMTENDMLGYDTNDTLKNRRLLFNGSILEEIQKILLDWECHFKIKNTKAI